MVKIVVTAVVVTAIVAAVVTMVATVDVTVIMVWENHRSEKVHCSVGGTRG